MKKALSIILLSFLFFVQFQVEAKNVNAFLSYATFAVPNGDPYIETYLAIEGNSVEYAEISPSVFGATLEITIIFRQNDSICNYSKYELKSPTVSDTSVSLSGFIDQQRYSLPNGTYTFELIIKDLNNSKEKSFNAFETFEMNYPKDELTISGIQFIESYTKAEVESEKSKQGYNLIPMAYAFYPETKNTITFFAEIYNSKIHFGEGEKFLLNYYIESYESKKKLDNFSVSKRVQAENVNVVFNNFDISELPSGNYFLAIEVRDKNNKTVVSNKVFFQRSNPAMQYKINNDFLAILDKTFAGHITSIDTLKEFIRSLAPIESESERDYAYNLIEKTDDLQTMQNFFYSFWYSRNNMDPEKAWRQYYINVYKVNTLFKTQTKKGYETDRGHIYLKYGAPDQIADSHNEPDAYPYEIWHYYTLSNQRNKRFVFYTKDIVTNDFELIHSDAVGELANNQWYYIITKRSDNTEFNVDRTTPRAGSVFGSKASEYYTNPR